VNVTDLARNLMANFAPEERSIPDSATYPGRNAEILAAINGALQELFSGASPWVRNDDRGIVLNPPAVNVAITVTNGSKEAEISAGSWQAWFAGCSIVINGSSIDNQIRNNVRNVVLRIPYDGPSGTTTAIVYHDRITLDADVLHPTGAIHVDGVPIYPVPTADLRSNRSSQDYGAHNRFTSQPANSKRISDFLGRPSVYEIETWSPSASDSPVERIRFTPAPSGQHVVEYGVKLTPPAITDIASTAKFPIPFQFVELILLPVAKKHLMESQFFRNTGAAEQIGSSYRIALEKLKELNPKKKTGVKFRPSY
jgi:hypothetical protein